MPIVVWSCSCAIFAAFLSENGGDILMASCHSPMEWRRTVTGLRIYVSTVLQQQLSRIFPPFGCCNVQRRVAIVGSGIYIGFTRQKQSGYLCITACRCSIQRGHAFAISGVHVGMIG